MEVPGVLRPSNSSQIDPANSYNQTWSFTFKLPDLPMPWHNWRLRHRWSTDVHGFGYEKHWKTLTFHDFLNPCCFLQQKNWAAGLLCHWLLGPSSAQGNLQPMTAPKVSTFLILFSAKEVSPASSVFLTELKSDSHNFGGWTYVHCVCVRFILKNNCWKLW